MEGFWQGSTGGVLASLLLFACSTLFLFASLAEDVSFMEENRTEESNKALEFVVHAVIFYVLILVIVGSAFVWWRATQAEAEKKEATLPVWSVTAGTGLAETLDAWKVKAGFHDVYAATGSIDTKASTDLDIHADNLCGAVEKLAKRLKAPGDVKFGSSCKTKEGVAMVYAMTKPRDADRTVQTATGACATYKPRYGTISIDKNGACQASPSHAAN